VDDVAKQRVDAVLDRIAWTTASGELQILRPSAAEGRTAVRLTAERLADESHRMALVTDARDAIRSMLADRYGRFNVGIVYGRSSDVTTSRERIEIAMALEDLVLATAVEDLLAPNAHATLATDGANLVVDLPQESLFPSVSYAPASTDDASTTGVVRAMQVSVVAVIVLASFVAALLVGIVPGLIGGCLAASIAASWIRRRKGDARRQESETP
jgi:hypothetical protein